MSTKGTDTTLLVLLVDRSGSMEVIRSDMEGGIRALLEEQAHQPGSCLVTIAQFDTEYELLYEGVPIAELDGYRLIPRGGTALLDALGHTIGAVRRSLEALPAAAGTDNVVFAVVTDGLENSSRELTRDQVMGMVKDRMDAGWHFSFLGANQDAIREGGQLGVSADASMTYAATPHASRAAIGSLSASIGRLRRHETDTLSYTNDERRASKGK